MSWSKDKWYTYKENGAHEHIDYDASFPTKALANVLFGNSFRVVDQDNVGNVVIAETMSGKEITPADFSPSWLAILGHAELQFFKEVDPFEYAITAISEQPKATTPSNDANELLRVMFEFKKRGVVVPSSSNFIDLDSYLAAIRVMLASEAKKATQKIEEANADLALINEVLK